MQCKIRRRWWFTATQLSNSRPSFFLIWLAAFLCSIPLYIFTGHCWNILLQAATCICLGLLRFRHPGAALSLHHSCSTYVLLFFGLIGLLTSFSLLPARLYGKRKFHGAATAHQNFERVLVCIHEGYIVYVFSVVIERVDMRSIFDNNGTTRYHIVEGLSLTTAVT